MSAGEVVLLRGSWAEHQLVDSGGGRKLERFGTHLLIRPEPKAWWQPDLPARAWEGATASYADNGRWRSRGTNPPTAWTLRFGSLTFEARLTDMSKHVGVFPEQAPHWQWIQERLAERKGKETEVLNLFGYTGAASLAAAASGARVTHVDASKPAVAWGRRNQELSGLNEAPVRWLLDDALKFVQREERRQRLYHGILLDPPSFGRGPKGELWKVEDQLVPLLEGLRRLLAPEPAFVILTLYNLEASALMLHNLMAQVLPAGVVTAGELTLPHAHSEKLLPLSLFARWTPA